MLDNKYLLRIEGKDPKRFVRSLIQMKINLFEMREKDHGYEIVVNETDYRRILEIKTIYQITLLRIRGPKQWEQQFWSKKVFFLFLFLGFALLLFLTNIIFDVEVIHTKKEIRDLVTEELRSYGLERLHFCLSFEKKEQIRSEILNKHKDRLEWMEIERIGTKYVVRVEERKTNPEKPQYTVQNVVAKKDGLITKIEAESGEIVAKKSQYVRAGDVLITGVIKNKDEPKALVQARGTVFAETWYKVTISLPLHYHEESLTGQKKKVFQLSFLGKTFSFFDFSPYQEKRTEKNILLQNRLFPLDFGYNLEQELKIIDHTYSKEEAINKANELAQEKVLSTLGVKDRIISQKDLKITEEDSKIVVEVFLKVEEDITDYAPIVENTEEPNIE